MTRLAITLCYVAFLVSFGRLLNKASANKYRKPHYSGATQSVNYADVSQRYVYDFNRFDKVFRRILQAEGEHCYSDKDIARFSVCSAGGEMVPLSTLVKLTPILCTDVMNAYNMFRSTTINGFPAAGFSLGDAITAMERAALQRLPAGYQFEWSGQIYQAI